MAPTDTTIIIIVITAMTNKGLHAKREMRALATLQPMVCSTAARVGSAAFRTDRATTHHDTQYARLFRS